MAEMKNPFADAFIAFLASKSDVQGCLTGLNWKRNSLLIRVTPPGDNSYEAIRDRTIGVVQQGVYEAQYQTGARSHRGLLSPFKAEYQELVVNGIRNLFLKITPIQSK